MTKTTKEAIISRMPLGKLNLSPTIMHYKTSRQYIVSQIESETHRKVSNLIWTVQRYLDEDTGGTLASTPVEACKEMAAPSNLKHCGLAIKVVTHDYRPRIPFDFTPLPFFVLLVRWALDLSISSLFGGQYSIARPIGDI